MSYLTRLEPRMSYLYWIKKRITWDSLCLVVIGLLTYWYSMFNKWKYGKKVVYTYESISTNLSNLCPFPITVVLSKVSQVVCCSPRLVLWPIVQVKHMKKMNICERKLPEQVFQDQLFKCPAHCLCIESWIQNYKQQENINCSRFLPIENKTVFIVYLSINVKIKLFAC